MAKVYKDLREFLATLEEEGQLIRIKEEVDPEPDIGAAGRACANMDKKPAVLFEKVKGYKAATVLIGCKCIVVELSIYVIHIYICNSLCIYISTISKNCYTIT